MESKPKRNYYKEKKEYYENKIKELQNDIIILVEDKDVEKVIHTKLKYKIQLYIENQIMSGKM